MGRCAKRICLREASVGPGWNADYPSSKLRIQTPAKEFYSHRSERCGSTAEAQSALRVANCTLQIGLTSRVTAIPLDILPLHPISTQRPFEQPESHFALVHDPCQYSGFASIVYLTLKRLGHHFGVL